MNLAFCPAQSGLKSPEPCFSAAIRKGVMPAVASGNAGAFGLIGPSSRMTRLTMPRAGLPLKRLVRAVSLACGESRALRWVAEVVASGQQR